MRLSTNLTLSGLALAILGPSTTLAEQIGNSASDVCEVESNDVEFQRTSFMQVKDGTLFCPLIRKNADSSSLTEIRLRVVDKHPTAAITCIVRSCNPSGSTCDTSDQETTPSGFSDGWYSMTMDDLTGYTNGFAIAKCDIPGENSNGLLSGVLSFRFTD